MRWSILKRLKTKLAELDLYLAISTFLLLIYGVVVIWSASPALAQKQLMFVLIGLPLFFAISCFDSRIFFRLAPYFFALTFLLLVITPVLGSTVRGAGRWFRIGPLTFQPSEIAKLALIIGISWFYCLPNVDEWKKFAATFLSASLFAGLVVVQPDLGTAVILLFVWLLISFLSGVRLGYFLVLFFAGLVFLPLAWNFLAPYQRERIFAFLNPHADPLGGGYNVLQAIIAVGSGKIFGRGLGRGPQSQLRFLPERSTDFIFASLAEEWGLLGVGILLGLFFLLLFRILRIGGSAGTKFGALLSAGIFAMIFVQVLINVGMNISLVPVTGIPLPLISAGGSSLLVTLASLGLAQSIFIHHPDSL